MATGAKDNLESATAPATPAEAAAESRRHQRGLIRGRGLLALGLGLLLLFAAVMAAVVFLNPLALDVPITHEVQEVNYGPADAVLTAVSAPGFSPWNLLLPALVIAGVALLKRVAEAAFLLLATLATTLDEAVKVLVHRGRPTSDLVNVVQHLNSYSFPSGHVTQYTLFFGLSFYFIYTLMKRGAARMLLLAFCAAMVVLVGPSRIWLGEHWASDVFGGYTLGFGLLLLIIWAYRERERRRLTNQAPLPPGERPAIMESTAPK